MSSAQSDSSAGPGWHATTILSVRKGDQVVVIAGKNKGQKGEVIRILDEKVVVQNVNLVKRHTKPNPQANQPGGIIERETGFQMVNMDILRMTLRNPDFTTSRRIADAGLSTRLVGATRFFDLPHVKQAVLELGSVAKPIGTPFSSTAIDVAPLTPATSHSTSTCVSSTSCRGRSGDPRSPSIVVPPPIENVNPATDDVRDSITSGDEAIAPSACPSSVPIVRRSTRSVRCSSVSRITPSVSVSRPLPSSSVLTARPSTRHDAATMSISGAVIVSPTPTPTPSVKRIITPSAARRS